MSSKGWGRGTGHLILEIRYTWHKRGPVVDSRNTQFQKGSIIHVRAHVRYRGPVVLKKY